jgi:hypothetical protein
MVQEVVVMSPGKQMLRRDVVPTRDFPYNHSGRVAKPDIDTTAAL